MCVIDHRLNSNLFGLLQRDYEHAVLYWQDCIEASGALGDHFAERLLAHAIAAYFGGLVGLSGQSLLVRALESASDQARASNARALGEWLKEAEERDEARRNEFWSANGARFREYWLHRVTRISEGPKDGFGAEAETLLGWLFAVPWPLGEIRNQVRVLVEAARDEWSLEYVFGYLSREFDSAPDDVATILELLINLKESHEWWGDNLQTRDTLILRVWSQNPARGRLILERLAEKKDRSVRSLMSAVHASADP